VRRVLQDFLQATFYVFSVKTAFHLQLPDNAYDVLLRGYHFGSERHHKLDNTQHLPRDFP